MKRRQFLQNTASIFSAASIFTLSGPGLRAQPAGIAASPGSRPVVARMLAGDEHLAPIKASVDRIIEMNVCTRPFRPQGPRIESERVRRQTIVHNYGHGGSGWSLSWGSGSLAVAMAAEAGHRDIAVVGCGAIGMTSALLAQRAGHRVTIYARELPPYVRSSFATGAWTPDSRICTSEHAMAFADRWERMARYSHRHFQSLLGLPGNPIEWCTMYSLRNTPFGTEIEDDLEALEPDYPDFVRELINDITPVAVDLPAGNHPFPARFVRQRATLLFNISGYSRLLVQDFLANGGKIQIQEFTDASDFRALDERTVINCTGYGARKLLNDESIIPVRGQTAKLIPQPEVNYGFNFGERRVSVYPRRDGLLVQAQAETDFGNDRENLDPTESSAAVERLASIVGAMQE